MYNVYGAAAGCDMNSCRRLVSYFIKFKLEKVKNGRPIFYKTIGQHFSENCQDNRYTHKSNSANYNHIFLAPADAPMVRAGTSTRLARTRPNFTWKNPTRRIGIGPTNSQK